MKAERHRGGSRERKTTAMTEWRSRWCLTCMPTQTLTCRTNFWSMYFLAMLGWNSWLSKNRMKNSYTNWREEEKERKRRDGGRMREREREREDVKKILNLCEKFNQACLISRVLDRKSQTPCWTTTSWLKDTRKICRLTRYCSKWDPLNWPCDHWDGTGRGEKRSQEVQSTVGTAKHGGIGQNDGE